MHPCCSLLSSHPLLLVPHPCPKSVLYVCISVAAMWTESSDPSFSIPCFSLSDWLPCLICSRFIPFIRTDSNVFLYMAVFHTGSDCSLAMFWGGSWSYFAPFQFGLPVWVLTAELLLGEPSEVCERRAARSSLAAHNPLWPAGAGCFAFRLGSVTSWRELCLFRAVRARAPG